MAKISADDFFNTKTETNTKNTPKSLTKMSADDFFSVSTKEFESLEQQRMKQGSKEILNNTLQSVTKPTATAPTVAPPKTTDSKASPIRQPVVQPSLQSSSSPFEGKTLAPINSTPNTIQETLKGKLPASSLLQQTGGGPANASQIPGISEYEIGKKAINDTEGYDVVKPFSHAANYLAFGNPLGVGVSRSFAGNSGATRRESTGNKAVDKITDIVNDLVTPFLTPTGAPVGDGPAVAPYKAADKFLKGKPGQKLLELAGKVIPGSQNVVRAATTEAIAGGIQNVGFGLQQGQDSGNEIARNALWGAGGGAVLAGAGAKIGEGMSTTLREIANTPQKGMSGSAIENGANGVTGVGNQAISKATQASERLNSADATVSNPTSAVDETVPSRSTKSAEVTEVKSKTEVKPKVEVKNEKIKSEPVTPKSEVKKEVAATKELKPEPKKVTETPTRDAEIQKRVDDGEFLSQDDIEYLLSKGDETPTPKKEVAATSVKEPKKQDLYTDLFGEHNLGISANRVKIKGQGPVTTEDQIVRKSIVSDADSAVEGVKAQMRAIYQDHVNAIDPMKKLGQEVYDAAVDANKANNIANVIINDKFVNLEGQVIGDSLKDVFAKVPRGQDMKFLDFLNLRRATTRMKRNEKVFSDKLQMTPQKVKDNLETLEKRYPAFKKSADAYYEFWDNFRQLSVDEGMMSPEMKKALETAEPYYVPQNRQFTRSEKPGKKLTTKSTNNALSGQKLPINKLTPGGSGRDLVDARKSTIETVGAWTNAMLRNRALQPVAKMLKANPDAFKGIVSMVDNTANVTKKSIDELNTIIQKYGLEGLTEAFNNNFDLVMNKGKNINLNDDNILRVMVDGEPFHMKVEDPEIVKAAMSMGPQATSLLVDIMGAMSNLTKQGATGIMSPLFAVKGATMDLATSAIQSKTPVKQAVYTVYSIFSGIGDALEIPGIRNWAQEYRRMGGGYSYSLKGERSVNKSIDNITRHNILSGKNAWKYTKKALKSPFTVSESVGNIFENAPRIAASKISLQEAGEITPKSVRNAMNAGRDATVNYSIKGLKTPEIESFAPYSNAAVQGTRRVLKAFKDNPVRTTAAVGVIAVLPKLIEYSRFHDDKDYQMIPARQRMRHVFLKKNKDGSFVKAPMDPTYESFGEMTIQMLKGFKDGDKNAFNGSMDALVEAWTPPLMTGLMQGFTKGDGIEGSLAGLANSTVFGPPSSILSNKSFTGAPIVSQSLGARSQKNQYDERTSSVAKKLGELTNFSPIKIDYIIKAYGGDAARIGLPLTSDLGQGNTRNTLLRNFMTDPTFTNTLSEDFYRAKDKLTEADADIKGVGAEPHKWYNEDLLKLVTSKSKESVNKRISNLRDEKREVTNDKSLTAKQRSDKLRELQRQINEIYIDVNSTLRESGVIK